jgi:hypothetical protein
VAAEIERCEFPCYSIDLVYMQANQINLLQHVSFVKRTFWLDLSAMFGLSVTNEV